MMGSIAGDVIGSVYEGNPIKRTEFPLFDRQCRFTDDTVLTIAVAYAILDRVDYGDALKMYGRKYPGAGYGSSFYRWMISDEEAPYNSWGNGSAMRVSPVGFAFDTAEDVLEEARKSAAVTHNHPEGIKGAQATALSIFLARRGETKNVIRKKIERSFGYDLRRRLDDIRPAYYFDISCQGSVPESIIAFLESDSFEDAIRKAISLGGDTDTMASITGGIAQAFYGDIPDTISTYIRHILPAEFLSIIDRFNTEYCR